MNQIMFESLSCEELNDINGGGIGKDVLHLVKFIVKRAFIRPVTIGPKIVWKSK